MSRRPTYWEVEESAARLAELRGDLGRMMEGFEPTPRRSFREWLTAFFRR